MFETRGGLAKKNGMVALDNFAIFVNEEFLKNMNRNRNVVSPSLLLREKFKQ